MLAITSTAAQAIKEIVASSEVSDDAGLRISLEPIDDDTAKLDLTVSEAAEPGDARLEQEGAKVFVEPTAASALDGMILDANVRSDGVEFSVVESLAGPSPNGQLGG